MAARAPAKGRVGRRPERAGGGTRRFADLPGRLTRARARHGPEARRRGRRLRRGYEVLRALRGDAVRDVRGRRHRLGPLRGRAREHKRGADGNGDHSLPPGRLVRRGDLATGEPPTTSPSAFGQISCRECARSPTKLAVERGFCRPWMVRENRGPNSSPEPQVPGDLRGDGDQREPLEGDEGHGKQRAYAQCERTIKVKSVLLKAGRKPSVLASAGPSASPRRIPR